jgi:membrane-anchored protein YejM (alkaline phosphatase superfamily)
VTESFKNFLNNISVSGISSSTIDEKKPFFSFLFYNSSHGYCEINNNLQPFTPVIENCNRFDISHATDQTGYYNRYRNALYLIDKEVHEIIKALKTHQQLDNTVIMITSDHGEEFNDNKQGYFGHASNFTRYQTQVPLIVFWPGEKPTSFDHRTTHYDIVPTLMEKLLGSQSPIKNYSIGKNLLQDKPHHQSPYLIMGSYIGLGIVEADRITSLYPSGEFQITELNAQPIAGAGMRMPIMQSVFEDLRRFYQVDALK